MPAAHYLEAWSDARTIDGTVSIVQPLIQPLYGGKSAHEVDRDAVGCAGTRRLRRRPRILAVAAARRWRTARRSAAAPCTPPRDVREGVARAGCTTASSPGTAHRAGDARRWRADVASRLGRRRRRSTGIEVNFRRDPTIYDGRFANNGWLQELPKPMTKLTWDNAALIAPATAEQLERRERRHDRRSRTRAARCSVPVWIMPGHAQDAITITVGYGRTRAGRVGNGTGFNAYALRGSDAPWFGAARRSRRPATTTSWSAPRTTGRSRAATSFARRTLEEFKANPDVRARRWST